LPTDTCQTDPDLARIVDAWPTLPEAVRAGIAAMVKAASGSAGTDHEIRADFDREAGATCGGWARFRMPGAYNQTARHAGECAE
jgi:hypothetical protein